MSKLADKRITIAKQVLETTDLGKLEAIEDVLRGTVALSAAEITELEVQLARIDRGEEATSTWAEVKARLLKGRRG